jgi:hypothetical protein
MAITLKNVNSQAASDISDVWWGLPALNTIQGTSGAIANGGDSGMGRFPAASDITPTIPSLPNVLLDSDQGIDGAVKGRPTETVTAVITGGVIDQIFAAAVTNRLIKEEGPHDYLGGSLLCLTHVPTAYVINRPGRVRDTGSTYGDAGWEVTELWSALADVKQFNQVGRTVQGTQVVELAAAHVGKTLWGETITAVDFGITRLWGLEPYMSEYPVTYHTFVGDGVTTEFTLDVTAASADGDAVQMWLDGTKQVYTTNYSIVTATGVITFVAAPAAGAVVVVKVMYIPSC